MTNLTIGSTELENDTAAAAAVLLLANYSFDLGRYKASELVERWLNNYPANWIRLAVIEALYQGRYKAISVEQILSIWVRRQPRYHFNHEFERLICSKLPQLLTGLSFTGSEETLQAYSQPDSNTSSIPEDTLTSYHIDETLPARADTAQTQQTAQSASSWDEISTADFSVTFGSVDSTLEAVPEQLSEPSLTPIVSEAGQKPRLRSENGQHNGTDTWASKFGPIGEFTPKDINPIFYTKLKAIAHHVSQEGIAQPSDSVSGS